MIAVIIPVLNEEKTVRKVVEGFPDSYRSHEVKVFVVDGGSSDATVEEAREAGAEIIHQRLGGGKGNGVKEALEQVEADFYVMLDGDGTYDPGEMDRMVDPLIDREAEHVIGRRSRREKGSIPWLNLLGNYVFNLIASITSGKKIRDMLSGYRSFTDESLRYIDFTRPGFGIETEMTFSALENHVPIKEVEISYSNRKGKSKLRPMRDGWRIFNTVVRSVRDLNPLKFFTSISVTLYLVALWPLYKTVQQKLQLGFIQDTGTAIATGILLILATQFMVMGLIADQIKTVEKRLRQDI